METEDELRERCKTERAHRCRMAVRIVKLKKEIVRLNEIIEKRNKSWTRWPLGPGYD